LELQIEDASGFKGHADSLFTPASEAELLEILRNATANKVPVTISGAKTGLTGGAVPQAVWKFRLAEL